MANNQQLLLGEGAGSAPAVYIEDVFSTYLYTGNASTQTITNGIDLSTKGGLVWCKARSNPYDNYFFDTARGANNYVNSNSSGAQNRDGVYTNLLTAFNAAGFSLGADSLGSINVNSVTYASWTFRKQPKFFDIVTWTGNNADGRFIAHSLGSTPGVVIIKNLTSPYNWVVWHRDLADPSKYLVLNSTAATATDIYGPFGSYFAGFTTNASCFTSTGFYVAADARSNLASNDYVAYIYAHDAGGFGLAGTDNVISCGSFTTDGSGKATITLGYEPQWLMAKASGAVENWYLEDNMRGFPVDGTLAILQPNGSNAEASSTNFFYSRATGFVAGSTAGSNLSASTTYIYIAIRRGPMKVPTVGTSVFSPVFRQGTSTVVQVASGFVTDLGITQSTQNGFSTGGAVFYDRLRGRTLFLSPSGSSAEDTYTTLVQGFDTQSGVIMAADTSRAWTNFLGAYPNDNYEFYANWFFKRAPGFFDVVCYTGTGSNLTVAHNLTVAPQLIIIKNRTNGWSWNVGYNFGVSSYDFLTLDNNDPGTGNAYNSHYTAAPTATQFFLATNVRVNQSSANFVAYLFATCAGVSKVGTYTGTGTTQVINCGFTSGARFVLIKRTDSTGNWFVWDSARGIIAGNDPYLLLNSTAAQVTNTDYIDTDTTGFEISSTAPAAINASAGTFIFLAIA